MQSKVQKGALANFLKNKGFFVVANGDGSNDVMMMKESHMVIAHSAADGTVAPGIGALSNLLDIQLRRLLGSEDSFYELFDIHRVHSRVIQSFAKIANSEEKPTASLGLKASKITFDLAPSVLGRQAVKEMYQQHWFSVGFDLTWLWIAYHEIMQSTDLPMVNQNISASNFISNTMGIAMLFAIAESFFNYSLFGESTNLISMLLMLTLLPIVLKSVFSSFKAVQEKLYPEPEIVAEEEKTVEQEAQPHKSSWWGSFNSYFKTPRSQPQPKLPSHVLQLGMGGSED